MSAAAATAYTRPAVLLHWLIAALIFLNIGIGLFIDLIASDTPRDVVLFWHASFGSLIFLLAVVRLAWRVTHRPPPLPATMPRWQVATAELLHWSLYLLMLAVPLTGYLHRSAGGHPVSFFGLGMLPVFIGKDEALRHLTGNLHEALVIVIVALVLGHIVAAVKHRFVDRDGVAERMLRAP